MLRDCDISLVTSFIFSHLGSITHSAKHHKNISFKLNQCHKTMTKKHLRHQQHGDKNTKHNLPEAQKEDEGQTITGQNGTVAIPDIEGRTATNEPL